jgi:hypothetical protein
MTRKELFTQLTEYYRIDDEEKYSKMILELNKYLDRTIGSNKKLKFFNDNNYIYKTIIENCDYFPTVSRLKLVLDKEIQSLKGLY